MCSHNKCYYWTIRNAICFSMAGTDLIVWWDGSGNNVWRKSVGDEMKRTRTTLDITAFPETIAMFITGATIYDSSCSEASTVYFIDKGQGFYLKVASTGYLKPEALMHPYFHSLGLTSDLLLYEKTHEKDYLITERIPGEDCTHEQYLSDPERLCDTLAETLRMLHNQPIENCPIKNRRDWCFRSVINGYCDGKYEHDLFEGMWEFSSDQEAWSAARYALGSMEENVLMHGDYCLPNIILDDWKFSGFIDLINAGVGDRHFDVLWGIWTLNFNLHTTHYTDRFIDAYGRELIDQEKLRCFAAMEMFL